MAAKVYIATHQQNGNKTTTNVPDSIKLLKTLIKIIMQGYEVESND